MREAGRVIAGSARGTRLEAPGPATRPLADRVKETLFAILEPGLRGARVLDLYAGSGAAGIEALSRGASGATFVERDKAALAVIERNLARTKLGGPAVLIVRGSVASFLDRTPPLPAKRFDVVVLDPPYDDPAELLTTLGRLGRSDGHLRPGGRLVAKHFWRDAPPARIGLLASERVRRFGETALTFYRIEEDG